MIGRMTGRMIRRGFLGLGLGLGLLAAAPLSAQTDPENVLVIEVDGEAKGVVEIALRPDLAPAHVARIQELARTGQYDGVVFHRVIDGFMAQTGDVEFGKAGAAPGQAGTGGSKLPDLPAEFSDTPFEKGVVGMARTMDPNSANSQFFIMFAPAPSLDGQYTVVGEVISGQDVVDAIKRGAPPNGAVADPDVMTRVHLKSDG
jgi:peptidylprolyl isomerase